MPGKRDKRFSMIYPLLGLLLGSAIAGMGLEAPAAAAGSGQGQAEVLHAPELEAGFHMLYELKPAEAHAQFGAWEKAHPEDPLGSASQAPGYLFEEC